MTNNNFEGELFRDILNRMNKMQDIHLLIFGIIKHAKRNLPDKDDSYNTLIEREDFYYILDEILYHTEKALHL